MSFGDVGALFFLHIWSIRSCFVALENSLGLSCKWQKEKWNLKMWGGGVIGQTERKNLEVTSNLGERRGCSESGADTQSTDQPGELHPGRCQQPSLFSINIAIDDRLGSMTTSRQGASEKVKKYKMWPSACFVIWPPLPPDLKALLLRVWAAAWGFLSWLWPFRLSPTWLPHSVLI